MCMCVCACVWNTVFHCHRIHSVACCLGAETIAQQSKPISDWLTVVFIFFISSIPRLVETCRFCPVYSPLGALFTVFYSLVLFNLSQIQYKFKKSWFSFELWMIQKTFWFCFYSVHVQSIFKSCSINLWKFKNQINKNHKNALQ